MRVLLIFLGAFALHVGASQASPVRVATLGGESRLLLDSTNLLHYPALGRQLAHVDVELFDDWAGLTVPLGARHALGLYLDRPERGSDELGGYLATTGSRLLRSLVPRPWLDVGYSLDGQGWALGAATRYAYDVRERGADRASASHWQWRLGVALGSRQRGLDATLMAARVGLSDRVGGARLEETDGNGYGLDIRGRWPLATDAVLLPSLTWEQSAYGLSPEEREVELAQAAIGVNVRPVASALVMAGVIVSVREERCDLPGDGVAASEARAYLLPALIVGGEVQVGSLLLRLGLRHESVLEESDGGAGASSSFGTGLTSDIGLGLEFGPLLVDGRVEKDFLRDGPHFIGGSARGGGVLSTASLIYRLYR